MYSVKSDSQFKPGMNHGFTLSKLQFVEEAGGAYVAIEFSHRDGGKIATRRYEPTRGYGETPEEKQKSIQSQQARLSSLLVSLARAYMSFEELKAAIPDTDSLKQFVDGIRKALPKTATSREVSILLVRDEKGYHTLPPTVKGLTPATFISLDGSDIEMDDYFKSHYLDKYEKVKKAVATASSESTWLAADDTEDDLPF